MQIRINDFMGCKTAEISVNHIALLGGRNAQGKSSVCRAVAYALAGQPVPTGLNKGAAGALIRSGAAKGSVEIKTDDGSGAVSIAYPKAAISSDGNPPRASIWAAGLKTVAEIPEKERVETLRDLIGAIPTNEDFVAALKENGLDVDKFAAPLWKLIAQDGWDATHKRAQDKGREIKAQWEYASGEKYGEKKAETWLPHNWSAGIEHTSKDSLEAIVTGARADLEQQIADAAVDGERLQALRDKASRIDQLAQEVALSKHAEETAERAHQAAKADLDKMPRGEQRQAVACPHCAGSLYVTGSQIEKAVGMLSVEEIEKQQTAYFEAQNKTKALADAAADARRAHAAAQTAHRDAVKAAADVEAMPQGGNASQADIDRAREALRVAEQDLKAWVQKSEADRLHKSVLANQQIIDLLSPEGVRFKVLKRALTKFNAALAEISNLCEWGAVSITPELDVEYNSRSYFFLSESEQFRARVTLQLKIAEMEQAGAVVIDGADVLDAKGRTGLFAALRELGIPAVVGMTWLVKPETLPDMAKGSCGQSYWVEAGVVRPLAEVAGA